MCNGYKRIDHTNHNACMCNGYKRIDHTNHNACMCNGYKHIDPHKSCQSLFIFIGYWADRCRQCVMSTRSWAGIWPGSISCGRLGVLCLVEVSLRGSSGGGHPAEVSLWGSACTHADAGLLSSAMEPVVQPVKQNPGKMWELLILVKRWSLLDKVILVKLCTLLILII